MTISSKLILGSATLIIALGLVACDGEPSAQSAGKSIDQAAEKTVDAVKDASKSVKDETVKMGDAMVDTAITAKVKAVILAEPGLNVLDIGVDTKDNITTLTGSIDSQQNRKKVEEITNTVEGVKRVDNQLLVTTAK
jgi:hyperosmotically inducible protein